MLAADMPSEDIVRCMALADVCRVVLAMEETSASVPYSMMTANLRSHLASDCSGAARVLALFQSYCIPCTGHSKIVWVEEPWDRKCSMFAFPLCRRY